MIANLLKYTLAQIMSEVFINNWMLLFFIYKSSHLLTMLETA